ncbi:universal stress protein [Fibrella forsythiae]|uniref:Universal stress protein n=1 Tax=Fibrella forsythiae TaxID=2817061 RepID=A0ABS3JP78_9BACT|nr:universal stress protein [Fibrella forsythiae]MBO0951799.1 universal stress protein [Fibrella forsythiae]
MYKILFLTDFSAASRHALAYTQALFDDTAADFCLVNAFQLQPELSYGGAVLMAEERETAEQALHNVRLLMTQQPVPAYHTYRTIAVLGGPETAVQELLAQEPFDLVVVGATGSGFSEVFGTVATGLIRTAKANVLVIPASAAIRPLKKLVLATDFRSINDSRCFTLLKDLASRKSAQLTLLTIENPAQPGSHPSSLSIDYVAQAFDTIQTDTYTIHDESVLNGINAYLDNHAVDLLVLLPHHKSFFDVLRNKSITRTIAYHPRVPLLSLYDAEPELPAKQTAAQTVDVIPFI